jgi:tetratricopeptide (TPR) repeat protein
MAEALTLNAPWLRERMAALGLTQWWVAEQVGVDRRTVMRWANGQVQTIRRDNAIALADVLECPVHQLLEVRESASLGSIDDQRAAARALAAADLLDRLGPPHQWGVAESLLKATAVSGLPPAVLGRLYYQLGVACWRQDKLAEASVHNDAALAIAHDAADHELEARALGSRANLRWWRGEVTAALADWQRALSRAGPIKDRERASLHSNLGAALYELGHTDAGRMEIASAVRLLKSDGTAMQRSIAHAHLALLALDCDDLRGVEANVRRSQSLARRAGYRRGLALAHMLNAEVREAALDEAGTSGEIARGLEAFAALGIAEAMTQRLAGRAWRRLGRLAEASAALRAGLPLAIDFPLERADLHAEAARVAALQGDLAEARTHADRAAALYALCEAHPKLARLATVMSPHVAWRRACDAVP